MSFQIAVKPARHRTDADGLFRRQAAAVALSSGGRIALVQIMLYDRPFIGAEIHVAHQASWVPDPAT